MLLPYATLSVDEAGMGNPGAACALANESTALRPKNCFASMIEVVAIELIVLWEYFRNQCDPRRLISTRLPVDLG